MLLSIDKYVAFGYNGCDAKASCKSIYSVHFGGTGKLNTTSTCKHLYFVMDADPHFFPSPSKETLFLGLNIIFNSIYN